MRLLCGQGRSRRFRLGGEVRLIERVGGLSGFVHFGPEFFSDVGAVDQFVHQGFDLQPSGVAIRVAGAISAATHWAATTMASLPCPLINFNAI